MSNKDPIGEVRIFGARFPILYTAIIIILVVFGLGIGGGMKLRDLNLSSLWEGVDDENFRGGVAFTIDEADWSANIAAAPTSPAFSLYYDQPTEMSVGKPVATGGSTITVDGGGDVWIDLYGGSDFYLIPDYSVLKSANPLCTGLTIEDYDDDGSMDYLARFDVSDVGETGQGVNPTMDISLPLLDQDTTSLAISAPADQTALGEAETVVTIEWTMSGVTADDGCIISEIWVTTNATTEGDRIDMEELSIGGGHVAKRISGSSMSEVSKINDPVKEENNNYNAWYIEADDDNDPLSNGALFVYRPTDETDDLDLKLNVRITFATNNKVDLTMNIRYVTPAGAKADLTDTCRLAEA